MKPVGRRAFLTRSAAFLAATGASCCVQTARAGEVAGADVGAADSTLSSREPFVGPHQSGILNSRPPQATFVALDCFAPSRPALAQALQLLSFRAGELMRGAIPPESLADAPPPDSGILGPYNAPDGLTVTIAFGASLFDGRYGLSAERPRELTHMPTFPADQLDPAQTHGDLLLQICAQHRIHHLPLCLKHAPYVFHSSRRLLSRKVLTSLSSATVLGSGSCTLTMLSVSSPPWSSN